MAIIVGVSTYSLKGFDNLPFCANDIFAFEDALINGLKVPKENIHSFGKLKIVKKTDFIDNLKTLLIDTNDNDVLLFYFSGHGNSDINKHYLVFSDDYLNTQEFIEYFSNVKAKTKVIFLDCCFSGNFKVRGTKIFDIEKTVSEFYSNGFVVFSSSNSIQVSYGHPNKPISLFTNYLCIALKNNFLIKEGKVSLYSITRLVSLYLEIWNKKNPSMQQKPIYRGNIGGTINFRIEQYTPYKVKNLIEEFEKYIIYSVEPFHHGIAKRFSVNVILKEPLSIEEISKVSEAITRRVLHVEIFNNEISEKYWTDKLANIIWIYFGTDESDIINNNYICKTTWVDENQDKSLWYQVNETNRFFQNNVHFELNTSYDMMKKFTKENSSSAKSVLVQIKYILSRMLSLAEQVINIYNEYINEVITEDDLYKHLESIIPEIDEFYEKSGNIEFAPKEIKDFDQECQGLFATIHNLTLYYNKHYDFKRSVENRKACMDMTIKNYYRDLDKVRVLEEKLPL